MTQTLLLKKPKNPKTIPSNMVCQWKDFNNDNLWYIVWKVLKHKIQIWYFQKTLTETLPMKKPKNPETIPSNIVYQWKIFINVDILYIV